ncbi:FMN-binding negative transcriptional regulator [Streptomyces yaizuensis]|uniref:FMN-binding negative transcriptional regulator n=1 Tax=Streptomyces yaizuensis TaxID=2989713 RepID=A0ABQ5P997_9ACTN|nr:FMN-binding negative transcriptional regulator [Streptomyces sp. YSPA8]GLF99163.1 FMN-binding negative transcriptional regulator [Streptomyces sp. YSPA8]
MFVPHQYREPDASWMADLVRRNPLALMMSDGGPGEAPLATHLPVIRNPGEAVADPSGEPTGLSGAVLLGHMNRANPHWAALRTGTPVRLAFTGPHAYVSPTVYDITPAAPTWNFTSVHLRGSVERIDSLEETLAVVQDTVRAFEAEFGADWDMTESLGYFRKIAPGVGAFRVRVTAAEGMFKLSQEQRPEIRERVRESFSGRGCARHLETADMMGRLG